MNDETSPSRRQSGKTQSASEPGNKTDVQSPQSLARPKFSPNMSYQQILRKLAALLVMLGVIFYLIWAME